MNFNHLRNYRGGVPTSVARGGGGGGQGGNCPPPPPIMLLRSFVGTSGNLSVHVSRQAYHLYRQNINCTDKILKEIALLVCKKCQNFLARSHKHRFSQCNCFVGILAFIYRVAQK